MRVVLLLLLIASALSLPTFAQQTADTISLAPVTVRSRTIDTTLELNRAGLSYRETDQVELYEGDGGVPQDAAVRLRCSSLSECRRTETSHSGPDQSVHAESPLRLSIRADAEPSTYLIEVRDSTETLRHYRRLQLRPPRPHVNTVEVRQGRGARMDTVLIDPREALKAQLFLIGGPFYPNTRVSLAQRDLETDVLGRDTLSVTLDVNAAAVRELLLGARRLHLTHPSVPTGMDSSWEGAAAGIYLKSSRTPRIDQWPRQINVEQGFREVAVEGADFSPGSELCVRSGSYDLGKERCIGRTERQGRTLRADVDFGTPPEHFVGGDIRLFVKNGDGQESPPVTVEVRPLNTTAEAELARTGDAVVTGTPTEVVFYRKETAPVFPKSGDEDVTVDDFRLRIGDRHARLFVENSDIDRVRAIVTVPTELGGETPKFDLVYPPRGHTWSGSFVPVARRPRLLRNPPPMLRRGESTRFVFSNGIRGTLVSGTDGVEVVEGDLTDAEATVEATTARTGSDARFYVQVGDRSIDSLDVEVRPWPHPKNIVRVGVDREGENTTVPVDSLSPIVLGPKGALRIKPVADVGAAGDPRVDVTLRKANGTPLSDPIALDFGQSEGRVIHPGLYGLYGGDRFVVVLRAPDGTAARQRVYIERSFLESWKVSGGFSAVEYSLTDGRASTPNGIQIAAHYMLESPGREQRPFGVGTNLIASGADDRVRVRLAGSVLFFETVAVGVGGWTDPFLFLGANVSFLDLSRLFRRGQNDEQ